MRTAMPMLVTLLSLSACTTTPEEKPANTGAMLSVDYFGGSDVVGFHFEITRVACDADDAFKPFTVEANVDLVDGIMPGMVELIEQTYDPDSRHLASDLFVSLEAGCYDVVAAPASDIEGDDWTPSSDCSSASAESVSVVDGATTEVTLISQCAGDPTGALDTTVTLNHPPNICGDDGDGDGEAGSTSGGSSICDGVTIDEKYNYECEPVQVCATAYDEDDDPIEMVLENRTSTPAYSVEAGPLRVVDFKDGHRIWEQCWEVVTQTTRSYDWQVSVYDLGYSEGEQVRMESLVSPETSHDDLTFPIHTNWVEEPLCIDSDGVAVPAEGVEIERAPGCDYTDAETYYCSGAYDVDPDVAEHLCEGTDLVEERLYPDCDDAPNEEPCDGIDNDHDGQVDENSQYGNAYTWTQLYGSGGNQAGVINTTTMTFNELDHTLSFATSITPTAGRSTNAFTLALSPGPNPKGAGNLALLYFDATGGVPVITVYAYNGLNTLTSYYDGSAASGTQAPDRIVSSLLDPSFVIDADYSSSSTLTTFSFTIEVGDINLHSPTYPGAYAWDGMQLGSQAGVWFHTIANATFGYSGGWISSLSAPYQSWYDTSYEPATTTAVCEPISLLTE